MSKSTSNKTISTLTFQRYKQEGRKIVALTAYDYSIAKILDLAGVDLILVGDSLAMVALGHQTTHAVTMDEMLHHTKAVVRGAQSAFVLADMPFMSYQIDLIQAITNAGRFIKEAGAQGVKLEGATHLNLELIERLVGIGIPVCGHLGFTPQSIHTLGGNRVQGRSAEEAQKLLDDSLLLQRCGCFAIVLEMVPFTVASMISKELRVPTIGIGAGSGCDGQILVTDDLLGKYTDFEPRFVRRYANIAEISRQAIERYASDVREGSFPDASESFALSASEESKLLRLRGLETSAVADMSD